MDKFSKSSLKEIDAVAMSRISVAIGPCGRCRRAGEAGGGEGDLGFLIE